MHTSMLIMIINYYANFLSYADVLEEEVIRREHMSFIAKNKRMLMLK